MTRHLSRISSGVTRHAFYQLLAAGLLLNAVAVSADTLTVTNLNDSGPGSLRDRVEVAIAGDVINFAVQGQITLASRLTIDKSLSIQGPASRNVTIRQANSMVITQGTVTISNLEVRDSDGLVASEFSQVVLINCVIAEGDGPAVLNNGTMEMYNCTILRNEYVNSVDCRPLFGAGIHNNGTLTMVGCTILYNRSRHNLNCPPDYTGSGLQNSGNATVTNCTFYGNSLRNEAGALHLASSTVVASGVSTGEGTVRLQNTILSDSSLTITGGGSVFSQGFNLSDGNGNGFLTNPRDQVNVDPKLGPLADNGGPTSTFLPGRGSPAIDRGFRNTVALDQRGMSRPYDFPQYPNGVGSDASDVGAVEASEFAQVYSFEVNLSTDANDGVCGFYHCTLREAVDAANANANANTITFAPEVTGTIALNSGQLVLSAPLTIAGPGARLLALSGGATTRIFNIAAGPCTISGLTLRDGVAAGNQFAPGAGGAMTNVATATFNDCAFTGNFAYGADAASAGGNGGAGLGGAVYNGTNGNLTFNRCSFQGNGVDGGLGGANTGSGNFGGIGGSGLGGAILNDTGATLALNNCTLGNNSATGGAGGPNPTTNGRGGNGGPGRGGGIFSRGTVTLTATTMRANSGVGGAGGQGSSVGNNGVAGTGSGGIEREAGGATLRNTIVAGNSGHGGPDVRGAFVSEGYNLIGVGDFGSGLTGPADQVGTTAAPLNARLGPLQNNGGLTDSMLPLMGSPALDRGKSFGLTTDQRGQSRPSDSPFLPNAPGGDGSEIGAVELPTPILVTTLDDHSDGACTPADCTLREAIVAANNQAGDQVIAFQPGLAGTIQLAGPLPNLASNMTIAGPGSRVLTVRRNTGGSYRIFKVSNGTATGPTVVISRLTIANGVTGGGFPDNSGGGIMNDRGTLTVDHCVITANSATSLFGLGGGVFNYVGTLFLRNSTVNGNIAGFGGAVASSRTEAGASAVTINQCTLSGNQSTAGNGGAIYNSISGSGVAGTMAIWSTTLSGNASGGGLGGAVYNETSGGGTTHLSLVRSTVSGNSGGGFHNQNSGGSFTVNLYSTIFRTGPSGPNLGHGGAGTFGSQGYNLSNDDGGGHLSELSDLIHTDPMLGPLQDNGGPTFTHALLSGSPAIDRGSSENVATDQRGVGFRRIIDTAADDADDGADIGAFEFGAQLLAASRKTHGSAGAFYIDLPVAAPYGVECRAGGLHGDHQIVLTFPATVSVLGGPQARVVTGQGVIGSAGTANGDLVTVSGSTITVPLTNVGNAQTLQFTLFDVSSEGVVNDVNISLGFLLGDTNGNGIVNASDIGQVKAQSGQAVTSGNFRNDVNTSGSINASDIGQVKAQSGTSLP